MYDPKNLQKWGKLKAAAPTQMAAFEAFDAAVMGEGTAIPVKYKELMAIAVAMTTQCPYCIGIHTKKAKAAGATDAEIVEATLISAALRAGASLTHGTHAVE